MEAAITLSPTPPSRCAMLDMDIHLHCCEYVHHCGVLGLNPHYLYRWRTFGPLLYTYTNYVGYLFLTHSLNIAAIQLQSSSHCYSLEPVAMAMAA